jgi:hypothetical protein
MEESQISHVDSYNCLIYKRKGFHTKIQYLITFYFYSTLITYYNLRVKLLTCFARTFLTVRVSQF